MNRGRREMAINIRLKARERHRKGPYGKESEFVACAGPGPEDSTKQPRHRRQRGVGVAGFMVDAPGSALVAPTGPQPEKLKPPAVQPSSG